MTDRKDIQQLVRSALTEHLSGAPQPAQKVAPANVVDESVKAVIKESDVISVPAAGTLLVRAEAVITPAAQDALRERGITLQHKGSGKVSGQIKTIGLGADHGGFATKEMLKTLLTAQGYQVRDFGTHSEDAVDYPDFAHAVAVAVANRTCDLGILIDGAGIGSCMVANKVPGVRAALCYDYASAVNSREHNDANVLTLGAGLIGNALAKQIAETWLKTPFGGGRHAKRIDKIIAVEHKYGKQS